MRGLMFVVALGLAQPAFAQTEPRPAPTVKRGPRKIDDATRERLRQLEAARTPPPPAAEPAAEGPILTARGRVEAVIDERIYLSVALTADEIARLPSVRTVDRAEDVDDGTLFEGRYRMSYRAGSSAVAEALLPLVGKDVVLDVQRLEGGLTLATAWRLP